MAVSLKNIDHISGCATFFYDDWAIDGDKLPRIGIAGKDALSTVGSCAQGSFAIGIVPFVLGNLFPQIFS